MCRRSEGMALQQERCVCVQLCCLCAEGVFRTSKFGCPVWACAAGMHAQARRRGVARLRAPFDAQWCVACIVLVQWTCRALQVLGFVPVSHACVSSKASSYPCMHIPTCSQPTASRSQDRPAHSALEHASHSDSPVARDAGITRVREMTLRCVRCMDHSMQGMRA